MAEADALVESGVGRRDADSVFIATKESSSVAEIAVQIATTLTSALLLGSALIGMLLGHHYLRDPKLPAALIRRFGDSLFSYPLLSKASCWW